jgi:hypothetical protein
MAQLSNLYQLERFDVGIVHLSNDRRVLGMNDLARRTLPVDELRPFDSMVLDFHPERSRPKVEFMLDQAVVCPVSNPPPMTMIINIPERVLLIKVTRLSDASMCPTGYVLIFHDITDQVSGELPARGDANQRRRLSKIPTVSGQSVVLIDAAQAVHLHSDGHYTRVVTADSNCFCNLSIGDLETRLDPEQFMRVHRSHIVNLDAIKALSRDTGRLMVQLSGKSAPVPVSRTSANALLERLGMTTVGAVTKRQSLT